MTNSTQEKPSTIIGTEDQTTQDTDKFVSDKGTEFVIKTRPNGLFYISMARGGVPPSICSELFTTRQFAERALERYLQKNDRAGYAQYPSKKKEVTVGES